MFGFDLSHTQLAMIGASLIASLWLLSKVKSVLFRFGGVHKVFKLSSIKYELHSTDLGGEKPKPLQGRGVRGNPDAIFLSGSEIIVGERKSRRFRGRPSWYEYYQVTLYMGLVSMRWPNKRVSARIRYANDVVKINYKPQDFEDLIALIGEYKESKKRGRAVNSKPLNKR